jgi:hypothetical protein
VGLVLEMGDEPSETVDPELSDPGDLNGSPTSVVSKKTLGVVGEHILRLMTVFMESFT